MHVDASRAMMLSMRLLDLPDLANLRIVFHDKFEEYEDSQKRFRIARDKINNQANHGREDDVAQSEEILISRKWLRERRIRKHETFHRFQLPPTRDEMRSLAGSGAIVSFITEVGMLASTLTQEFGVRVIELPQVEFLTLVEYVLHLTGTSRQSLLSMDERPYVNKIMAKSLLRLWETVVYPIVKHLGHEHQRETVGPLRYLVSNE